ncbi:ABC transporter ATP-binding protein [Tissierella sp. MB52-C2]|uniref:ABC transporter ATP-binding protein n=1 Tax=Tissierella sp. MB52-C2 TaxID=3070999 RepID=UPI00280BFF83|nr:ABC transporter ATP-binding protein [Tissierella sp. MB52-C2]WMM24481.1 ABC transporter ATP-binding protein [Tissierella sp. MB52-C2]
MKEPLLSLKDLKVSFFNNSGEVKVIRGVSFNLEKGEVLGVVGESGSGKSVTSMSIIKLLKGTGKITEGEIIYKGENLVNKTEKEMMRIRGNDIAMIFQDPMTSLNPVFTVGSQISDVIRRHQGLSKGEAKNKAIEMLRIVGIPSPEERYNNYPHEFSGGMRQRAIIAMALSCEPELLIADEPTTALDVTIQAQILELLMELKKKMDTSIILITHDLGVVANMCSRVIVMYGGLIMEEGFVDDIFYNPMHPYTKGLLQSLPKKDSKKKQRLIPIKGNPPDLSKTIEGCPFAERCPYVMNICKRQQPEYYGENNHRAMCWLLDKGDEYNGK